MTRSFLAPDETPPAQPPRFPSKPAPGRPPRRRGLLGAVAALAVAPAVVEAMPAASPDAALIAECQKAIDAWGAMQACYRRCPINASLAEAKPYENEADRLMSLSDAHETRAMAMPAKTPEGVAAKARMLVACALRNDDGSIDTDYGGRGAWALIQEVLRLEGVA